MKKYFNLVICTLVAAVCTLGFTACTKTGNKESVKLVAISGEQVGVMGIERIKRNLSLETEDVVDWCKMKINSANAVITRNGKNWYVHADNNILTVNAHSYTIITAHKAKK